MSIIYAQINENGQFDAFTNAPIEGWYEIKNPPQEMLDCSIRFQPDGQGGIEKISDEDFHIFKKGRFKMKKYNLKDWIERASIRAIKTMAQTAVSLVTIGNMVTDMDWISIISISLTAGIASILTSIAGLPECEEQEYKA